MSAEDFGAVELRGVREERLDEVSSCNFYFFPFLLHYFLFNFSSLPRILAS